MPSIDDKSDKSKSQQSSISTSTSAPPGDNPPPKIDLSKESFLPEMRQIANNHLEQQKLQELRERQQAMVNEIDSQHNSISSGQQPVREQNQNKSYEGPER